MTRRLKFEIVNYLTEVSKTNELYIDDISDIINEKHDIQTQDVTVEKTIDNIAEILTRLDSDDIYNLHYERIYFFICREDNMDSLKEEYVNTPLEVEDVFK